MTPAARQGGSKISILWHLQEAIRRRNSGTLAETAVLRLNKAATALLCGCRGWHN
ncbi:MAG: hypothetical protein RQ736_09055 [Thiogranum sp.]|nr:hypothetical protein [Thiogranum sp.]